MVILQVANGEEQKELFKAVMVERDINGNIRIAPILRYLL
jgi:hypothetical protein